MTRSGGAGKVLSRCIQLLRYDDRHLLQPSGLQPPAGRPFSLPSSAGLAGTRLPASTNWAMPANDSFLPFLTVPINATVNAMQSNNK